MAEYPLAQSRLDPLLGSAVEPVSGGFAIYAGVNSPLTRAVGMGLSGPVDVYEFERMEEFFRSRGAKAVVDVCPLADKSLVELLRRWGYHLMDFNNVWFRELDTDEGFAIEGNVFEVREAHPSEADVWVRTVARGFAGLEEATREELDIAAPLFEQPKNRCFLALSDDGPVGGGAIRIEAGNAALFSGSTIREFRARGVQTALLHARLKTAVAAGCDLASIKTSPGNASQRNVERAGFRLAYTKAIMAREFNV